LNAASKEDVKRLISQSEASIGSSRLTRELENVLESYVNDWGKRSLEASLKARYEFTEDDYQQFRNIPVGTLIDDPYFLGLKNEMFPIHREELILAVDLWRKGELEEVVEITAMGGGKTFKMSAFAYLIMYYTLIEKSPPELYGLAPKTNLGMAIMSKTGILAKEVTFMQILPFFDCPFFNDYFPPQVNITKVEDVRRYPKQLRFPKRITLFPGTGTSEALRGHNIIATLLDEFPWMEKVLKSRRNVYTFGGGYDAAEEIYITVSNRMFSRAPSSIRRPLILMFGSPRTKWDFAEIKYEQGRSHPLAANTTFVKQAGNKLHASTIVTETGVTLGTDGTIDVGAIQRGEGRKIISFRRKPLWRGRPQKWKGVTNWSGKYMLFDCDNLRFVGDKWYDDLFKDMEDYDAHGFFKVPVEAIKQFQDSPEAAIRDIGSVASGSINRFFREADKLHLEKDLENNLIFSKYQFYLKKEYHVKNIIKPSATRYIHIDMGLSEDACGIACCFISNWIPIEGREGRFPVFTYDFFQELKPEPGKQLRISAVDDLLISMKENREVNLGLVTFDQYQSVQSVQDLWEDHGIPSGQLSIDNTTHRVLLPSKIATIRSAKDYKRFLAKAGAQALYGTMREGIGTGNKLAPWFDFRLAMYQGRILLPGFISANFNIMTQMEQEEYYPIENKIDHPPKGSHDGLQAVVGAFFNAMNNEWYGKGYQADYTEDASDLKCTIEAIENEMSLQGITQQEYQNFLKRKNLTPHSN